ncbi:hypothetical protein [Rhizobium leguminosarum]|uniref:hypothetical protein n=1 Tax=Rhizobium leguminosarum TaxID=384 RepID=UPI001C967704|nr:hypothetical protein [Rhizobium leguminosarum]MBY5708070.1 hypothetical protein [Rhizobium leguminosarum]
MKGFVFCGILVALLSSAPFAHASEWDQLDNVPLFDLGPNHPSLVLYAEIRCAALNTNSYWLSTASGKEAEKNIDKFRIGLFNSLISVHPLRAKLGSRATAVEHRLMAMYYDRWEAHAKKDGGFFDPVTISDFKVCNYLVGEKYAELYEFGHALRND